MRKIRVTAIQSKYPERPDIYNCFGNNYKNDPQAIVKDYVEKAVSSACELLEKAGEMGSDIVTTIEDIAGTGCFIEDVTETNIFEEIITLAQPIIEARFSEIARKYSMYIIACYNKRIDGKNYNVGVIFDRQGKIAGEQRKVHLPSNERWQCSDGESIDVFELDFGKIGICICYDMMFPEYVQVQALKGAQIIFHPTLGYGWYDSIGEATLRTRANDNSVYIVTAKNYRFNGAGKSSIIDFWGQVLADAGFYEDALVSCEIDMDAEKLHPAWYYPTHTSGVQNVAERMRLERNPRLYSIISEELQPRLKPLDRDEQLKVLKKIKSNECRW